MNAARPHLVLIHPQFRPDGGAERAILNILTALREDIRITVISRGKWQADAGGIRFVECNPFSIGRFWKKWSFIRAAQRTLTTIEADIVQSQVRLPGCDIYRAGGGVHAQWLKQRKRILSRRKNFLMAWSPYHNYKLHLEKKMYSHPALKAVICNSGMVKQELLARYALDAGKVWVIHNAVDLTGYHPETVRLRRQEIRRRLGIADHETVYLFVGSGFERKGLDLLLRSFAGLPKDTHLIIVGKDKHQSRYRKTAAAAGVDSRTHFMGMQTDVKPFYGAADVFVLPTLYDAFANTVLEAMACGLPVVTSSSCGAVDIIVDGENGFIIDPFDKTRLTACLDQLRIGRRREAIGAAGRTTVGKLSIDRMRENLLALYRRILE